MLDTLWQDLRHATRSPRRTRDPLPLTPGRSRLAAGQTFAMLAKSGDPAEHLIEQDLRVALAFLCALANLPPKLVRHVREANQHVIASAGEAFVHFAAHGRKSRPHLAAYIREFNAHFGAELQNLRLYRAYSLTECRDLRGQCLESFHSLIKAFYAIRQQFIRHQSSALTRHSNSKRAFNGRIRAGRMPTTLPSSLRADNSFRTRISRARYIDPMSTLEAA